MAELWKEYAPDYFGSNLGRVKSFKRGKEKILKQATDSYGYLFVVLYIDGERKYLKVHRIVAELFIPNPDNKPQVNHKNGIKSDNRAENLEWVTNAENQLHAVATGLAPSGEDVHNAKFNSAQIIYIRNNPDGLTGVELAEKFGVGEATVSAIQLGRKYKNVGGQIRQTPKQTRLSENEREEIRILYKTGEYTRFQLSKMFDCSHGQIDTIVRGK